MSSRRRTTRPAATAALVVAVLVGCAPSAPAERVPDAALFETIADLDGVTGSTVEFRNVFGYSPRYVGDVEVSPDADAMCVLFQTIGILRQGRAGVELHSVEVVQGGESVRYRDLSGVRFLEQRLTFDATGDTPEVPDCTGIPDRPTPPGSAPTATERATRSP